MVLGPEQVTTIFHNYLRSSVIKFRRSRSESMSSGHRWCRSPGSSVVQVTGGYRWCNFIGGNRWCRSPGSSVVQVTGGHWWCKSSGVIGGAGHRGHRWCRSPGSSGGGCHSYKRYIMRYFFCLQDQPLNNLTATI